MTTAPIYPAYAFNISPTYNAWVKLTATDIHLLRPLPGFEGQNLFFHLNHPIRFVSLVAPVVAIDDVNKKYTLLTLDDGSGQTIQCKISRVVPAVSGAGPEDGEMMLAGSNTTVSNLSVADEVGRFEILVDGREIDVSTVLKVKCTLETFRGVMQLHLKRVSVVRSTREEGRAWREIAAFRSNILAKPWVIEARELRKMERDVVRSEKREGQKRRAMAQRLREKEIRHAEEKKQRHEQRKVYEVKRQVLRKREALEMDRGALA